MNCLPLSRFKALFTQAIEQTQRNPQQLLGAIRAAFLCYVTELGFRLVPHSSLQRGVNVRVQKRSSIQIDKPHGKIEIGANSIVYESAKLHAVGHGIITLGTDCIIGPTKIIARDRITIGARFLTSWGVLIQDYDPHPIDPTARSHQVQEMTRNFIPSFTNNTNPLRSAPKPGDTPFKSAPIVIGDDVWIGANAVILKGASIGNGCVIGANAVITRGEYPAGSVLAGNPAKVVRAV